MGIVQGRSALFLAGSVPFYLKVGEPPVTLSACVGRSPVRKRWSGDVSTPVIGIAGHADLDADTEVLLEAALRKMLEPLAWPGISGLVRARAGAVVVFGRVVRDLGGELTVVLPSLQGVPAPLSVPDREAAGQLLVLATEVRLLDYDPADHGSCVTADEELIRGCERLIGVWDGSPSTSRDATAHLIAFARGCGLPVDVVWPAGATRTFATRTSRSHQ